MRQVLQGVQSEHDTIGSGRKDKGYSANTTLNWEWQGRQRMQSERFLKSGLFFSHSLRNYIWITSIKSLTFRLLSYYFSFNSLNVHFLFKKSSIHHLKSGHISINSLSIRLMQSMLRFITTLRRRLFVVTVLDTSKFKFKRK